MAVPTLALEEYQFEDTGIKLNSSPSIPFCDITSIDGLDNVPYNSAISNQDGRDGGYVDALYEGVRTVTLEGTIYASSSNVDTYLDSLKYNFRPQLTNSPLYFNLGTGQTRLVYGKSLGIRYKKEAQRRLGKIPFQVQIACEDPRIYDSTVTTATIAVAGNGNVVLIGNRPAPADLRLNGPLTNPIITFGSNVITFTLTLTPGQYVDIDLAMRSCIKSDGTSVRHLMTFTSGNWYFLGNTTNTFSLAASAGTGNLVVTAQSCWR